MLVVVVDDNPDDRALVRHRVEAVFPSAEIREAMDEGSFAAVFGDGAEVDLVITDYALRWSTGLDILARVKGARPDCPVIMFTGTGDEETAVAGMKAGLDDYVVKSPRHFASFQTSVRTVIENARSRAALRETEDSLRAALRQKDVLLRELHHRVKNNLQTAIALLTLRAHRASAPVRHGLLEVAQRLQALAQVQSRILADADLAQVDVASALTDLARSVAAAHPVRGVRLDLAIARPLNLPVARAAPLALLCHELILNAFKHAFPEGRGGTLRVTASMADDAAGEVTIADDGVGFDPMRIVPGMGGSLARALAAEALAGLDQATGLGRGTRVTLRLSPVAKAPPGGAAAPNAHQD